MAKPMRQGQAGRLDVGFQRVQGEDRWIVCQPESTPRGIQFGRNDPIHDPKPAPEPLGAGRAVLRIWNVNRYLKCQVRHTSPRTELVSAIGRAVSSAAARTRRSGRPSFWISLGVRLPDQKASRAPLAWLATTTRSAPTRFAASTTDAAGSPRLT